MKAYHVHSMYHKDFVCYFLFPSSHILIDTRHIKMFVLDEADEMLSRGFKDQIYDVFRKLPSTIQVRLGWEEWHTTVSSCHLLHFVALFPSLIPRPSSGHDHSHHDPCYSIATVTSLCSLLHSHPLTYPHAIYDVHMHTHLPHPPTHILPPYVPHPHISHILTYPTPSHPHPPTHLTQVILLSATMPMDVLDVTKRFMREPIRILVKKEELTLEGIRQFYIQVEKEVSGSAVPSLQ